MKVLVLPLGAIAVILAFSLWAGSYVQQQADTWEQLLDQAAAMNAHPPRTAEECRAYYEELTNGAPKPEE